jgi:hypothetical protein
VLVVPQITGENTDQVAVKVTATEMPESILAGFGLDGVRTESTRSALSAVLDKDQFDALHRTFDEMFQERIKNKDNRPADEADQGENLMWLGSGSVTSSNGQPVNLNYVVAYYDNTWVQTYCGDGNYGENVRARTTDGELDLGPYGGPLFTMTPVILSDRNSVDLALQATIFWRFENSR